MQVCPTNGTFNHTHPYPKVCVNNKHLDLNTTQIIFHLIYEFVQLTGTPDWRVDENGFPTHGGCVNVTGRYRKPTWYSGGEIWGRLTNWKLPLLQLVFLTALPALSFRYQAFVLSRLLGNPIGTIQDLLLKLSSCQAPARKWIRYFRRGGWLGHIPQVLRRHQKNLEMQRRTNIPLQPVQPNGSSTPAPPSSEALEERFAIFKNRDTLWKAITIIIVSYDEYGHDRGFRVSGSIEKFLKVEQSSGFTEEFLAVCLHTAGALAADRYTSILPILAAQLFFVFSIATPFIQIRANGPISPGVFLNIEAYSIAFSLLFFWIIFTTMVFAVVGGSQSQDRIPSILNYFQSELRKLQGQMDGKLLELRNASEPRSANTSGSDHSQPQRTGTPALDHGQPRRVNTSRSDHDQLDESGVRTEEDGRYDAQIANLSAMRDALEDLLDEDLTLPKSDDIKNDSDVNRESGERHENYRLERMPSFGIIPSWQPGRWNGSVSNPIHTFSPSGEFKFIFGTFGILLVTYSYLMGFWVAWDVPPRGFECRHICLTIMWALWMSNYFASLPTASDMKRLFWYNYARDTFVAILLFLTVILTQCGILNSCACYTIWKTVNMPLSQLPKVADELYHSFKTSFAGITFSTIVCFYIIVPGLVLFHYRDAARVFLQADNGNAKVKSVQRFWFWFGEKNVPFEWVWKPMFTRTKSTSARHAGYGEFSEQVRRLGQSLS